MKQNKIKTIDSITSNNKKNIASLIFVRACCCLGIVIYHYFEHARGNYKSFFRTANSNIGLLFVTSFFNISGTVLYYNYPKVTSIKKFYYKRWKSILIPYYICNFLFYISVSLIKHKLIYKGPWNILLFNLIGLDGYLQYSYNYKAVNFGGIGEWFLGAIIIIYFLYPLIVLMMNINIFIINYIILINYYIMYKTNIYANVLYEHNIFTCLKSFYFGMIVIKFKNFFFKKKLVLILCFLLLLFLFLFEISKTFFLISQIHGFALYIFLLRMGEYIMRTKFAIVYHEINGLSYSIFLYHHYIIRNILQIYNPIDLNSHLILLFETIFIILIYSKIHSIIVGLVLKSKIFKIMDSFFLS